MIKKIVSLIILSFILAIPSILSAEEFEFRPMLGIKGGLHVPMRDYGDAFDTGFTIGLQYKSKGLQGKKGMNFNILQLNYIKADASESNLDSTMIEIQVGQDVYPFALKVAGYPLFIRFSFGYNFYEIGNYDNDAFMIQFGGGLNIGRNFELALSYNHIFDSDVDANIDYTTFTLGYNF